MNSGTKKNPVYLTSVGTAVPPLRIDQKTGGRILTGHYTGTLKRRSIALLEKLFDHPSIAYRHFALDEPLELFSEGLDDRIERFTKWSIELSSQAIVKALTEAQLKTEDIECLIVNTCTGYICPGISTYLIERLGLRRNVKVYDLVGSGCGGAIPNLQLSEAMTGALTRGVAVSVSSEICSATFQVSDDLSLLVSNTLFGDGAAAAVLSREPGGMELVGSASMCIPEQRDYIRYVYKQGQLHNQLSMQLDDYVRKAAASVVEALLAAHELGIHDIAHWALHTGGEKIINAVRDELGLDESKLAGTRAVLRDYGNMSSPTVYFVLQRLMEQGMQQDDLCVMLAFGAGLSAHACLLRKACRL
ncbi:MAG TPA: type III polyketide synthase [Dissulfurispiraceae bacterium]|nr:type III polyketide synthase [Dissulfurispiraceae bacterium]